MKKIFILLNLFFILSMFVLLACTTSTTKTVDLETLKKKIEEQLKNDIASGKAQGIPIVIKYIAPKTPNSVGGVSVNSRFINTSDETIKYIHFTAVPYNSVGDIAPSTIAQQKSAILTYTGPMKPEQDVGLVWENVWYNRSISCVELTNVKVIFMNNKTKVYTGKQILKLLDKKLKNSCKSR